MADYEADPLHPDVDAHLRQLSASMESEEVQDLESDLERIAYQQQVLDALVLEGVDIGMLSILLEVQPDPTLQETIHRYQLSIELLQEAAVDDVRDEHQATRDADALQTFIQQQKLARCVHNVAWARKCTDYGDEAQEVKISTQLEIYRDPTLSIDEKQLWLRILDRIIPEVRGLDPTDPQTATEIENWLS